MERNKDKWGEYAVEILPQYVEKLSKFKSLNEDKKNLKPLRLTKRGVEILELKHKPTEFTQEKNVKKINLKGRLNLKFRV